MVRMNLWLEVEVGKCLDIVVVLSCDYMLDK